MRNRLARIYYSPKGYWRGLSAIKKLAEAGRVSEETARAWLSKQAVWQIYLPTPKRISRPRFNECVPNKVHQADLLFLPHDHGYKYALTVIDVASRYKEAEPLKTKKADEVTAALSRIYKRSPLTFPAVFQVDPGREFMGSVSQMLKKHDVIIRRGHIHRDQGMVERFNRTLAERLFTHQYAQEMVSSEKRSTEWVKRLPAVIAVLNSEVTRLIGKKPKDAIKEKSVIIPGKSFEREAIPRESLVRYLYSAGELEGFNRRATDPIWSLKSYRISHTITQPNEPTLYYLEDGPKRAFMSEELQIIPPDTELPPKNFILNK